MHKYTSQVEFCISSKCSSYDGLFYTFVITQTTETTVPSSNDFRNVVCGYLLKDSNVERIHISLCSLLSDPFDNMACL